MRLETIKLLEDMGQAARSVATIIQGKTIEQFKADIQFRWAVKRGFEIVGEALTQLRKFDSSTAESITDWRAIIGFRHVLIHGYAVVNSDKTWDIAVNELPGLVREIELLLT